jgi:DNA adenine methylase
MELNMPLQAFSYFGGKYYYADRIIALFPPHDIFVDVFGGSGVIVASKPPAKLDVYNDLDQSLVNFFHVLRDPKMSKELIRLLELTPYARSDYMDCLKSYTKPRSRVERARRYFVAIAQSFSSNMLKAGWSHNTVTSITPAATSFINAIDRLQIIARRFREVQVDNRDFRVVLDAYDSPHTLFYCDPPYLAETRKSGKYQHEMSEQDHQDLLTMLVKRQAKMLLSGYDSDLYHDFLSEWECVRFETTASAVGRNRASGNKGKGKILANHTRIECVWISPNAIVQPRLFSVV